MQYNKIKSEFVKNELKKTKWKNRKYIDDLIDIEGFVFGEHWGLSSGYLSMHLKDKYPWQWKAVWMELKPKEYKRMKKAEEKDERKIENDYRKIKKEEITEKKQRRKEWLAAGGKL